MATKYITDRNKIDGNGMTAGELSGMIIGILTLLITLVGVGCTILHLWQSTNPNPDIGNPYSLRSIQGLTSVHDPRDPDRERDGPELSFVPVQTIPPPAHPLPVARPDHRDTDARITEIVEANFESDGRAPDERPSSPPPE
ncbi:hypothetical protein EDC01DRAFT_626256 [Geopyxis carbonaria]|nr:hypothetical protein EDC01DRAFT_626256 [Geopyxis carbonaria]